MTMMMAGRTMMTGPGERDADALPSLPSAAAPPAAASANAECGGIGKDEDEEDEGRE
jgi:hypothetical protein